MLSEIEREKANPTLAVAVKIARAFGLALSELVDFAPNRDEIAVTRADDQTQIYREDHGIRIRTLSPLNLEKDVEFYELTLQPGAELKSAAHFDGTREFLTVETGHLQIHSGTSTLKLGQGDSASYRADVPHCIANAADPIAVAFLVVIYR